MIKVTIGESKTQQVKDFPKLMIGELGSIVFFTSDNCGIFLSGTPKEYVGLFQYHNNWNMSSFTDYNEPITIQNQ